MEIFLEIFPLEFPENFPMGIFGTFKRIDMNGEKIAEVELRFGVKFEF